MRYSCWKRAQILVVLCMYAVFVSSATLFDLADQAHSREKRNATPTVAPINETVTTTVVPINVTLATTTVAPINATLATTVAPTTKVKVDPNVMARKRQRTVTYPPYVETTTVQKGIRRCPGQTVPSKLMVCIYQRKVDCAGFYSAGHCVNLKGGPFLSGWANGNYHCAGFPKYNCPTGPAIKINIQGYRKFPEPIVSFRCDCSKKKDKSRFTKYE